MYPLVRRLRLGRGGKRDGHRGWQIGRPGRRGSARARVQVGDKVIRQRLLAFSDIDRSYTYAYLEPAPVRHYQATISVLPVVETGQAFVQWSATFDCAEDTYRHWTEFFAQEGFAKWLAALRRVMAERRHT